MTQSPQDIRRLEEKLLQQKSQLEHLMLTAVKQGREATLDDGQDTADQAVSSYQKEFLFSQGTKGHSQIGLIRQALERINDGSYGDCLHCSTTIGPKRLEALPWTPYCIACQEKIENGEIEDPVRAA